MTDVKLIRAFKNSICFKTPGGATSTWWSMQAPDFGQIGQTFYTPNFPSILVTMNWVVQVGGNTTTQTGYLNCTSQYSWRNGYWGDDTIRAASYTGNITGATSGIAFNSTYTAYCGINVLTSALDSNGQWMTFFVDGFATYYA
jgi:hypothetical protein